MEVTETPPPKKKRRWWKWLKRLMLAFAVLLGLAVAFHGPLLRWIVTYAGTKGAHVAGIDLKWTVNGSVLGDLHLRDIEASGSLVESAHIGEISAEYDSWRFIKTRDVDILKSVKLKDVQAVLDMRKLKPATEDAVKPKKTPTGKPPPLIWPKTIDIDNVNLDITLLDGRQVSVRGLSLRIGEGMPGTLRCAEFSMMPGDVHVKDLAANVEWGDRQVTISTVKLPYGGDLSRLHVDLRRFREDMASAGVEMALGKSKAKVDMQATGLFNPPLRMVADLNLQGLSSGDLAALKLPPNIEFDEVSMNLHAEGPTNVAAKGEIRVSGVRAAGAIIDEIVLPIDATQQRAVIDPLRLTRGTNEIVVRAEAALPANVAEWQKIAWKTHLDATLRDVPQLLEKPPPVLGVVVLKADAEGLGATPRSVTGRVDGTGLGFENYRLPSLGTDFAMNGKEATVNIPALELGTGNRLSLNAAMTMDDTMPIRAQWNVEVNDPALLLKTVNLPPLEQPVTAKVALTGKAAFLARDVMNLDADVALTVREGRYNEAPLPVIEVKAKAAKGLVTVESLQVVADEKNRIDLTGSAKLASPWPFDVSSTITLPELTKLNTLLQTFKAPPLQSGAVGANIKLRGNAYPWSGEGRVELNAAKVKMESMPEAADVALKATFAGTTAELQTLEAVLGPWKLLSQGVVTDREANLRELSLWQNKRQLLSGRARVPFDLMDTAKVNGQPMDIALTAKDLPVGEIAAAAGIKTVPPAIVSMDIKAEGRLDTADVLLKIGVREAKAPGLPKSLKPATANMAVLLRQNQLSVDGEVLQAPLQPVKLKAEMPLNLAVAVRNPAAIMETPIKATVEQAESDLSFAREFAATTVRSLPAKMSLNARVGGTLKAPLIDSNIVLDVPEVGFVSASMPSVRDVRVRLRSHDRNVVIEDLSVVLAGGHVKVGGTIDGSNVQDPRFDVRVQAREALVYRDPTSSVRANGNLTLAGTLKSARLGGLVEIVRGRVFREVDLMPNVFRIIPRGEDLPPPPPSTERSEKKLVLPALMAGWTFDVRVRTREPVVIAGNLVNGTVTADVALGGTGAAPRLTGGANVDRMLVKLPFSQMKITKGEVTMNPNNPLTPNLDVRGESRVGEYDITMYVYGDSSDPKPRFSSSPPLSEADIVTLLSTGITLNGDSSQLASQVATRALLLVVSETYRKIFHKQKKVDMNEPKLRIRYNPTSSDQASSSTSSGSGSGMGSAEASYELTPKVRFTGRFMQSGRVSALLGYVLRFGKAARAMDEEVRR